jgi:anthranilate phosphoribosyltransferase
VIKEALAMVVEGRDLTRFQARDVMHQIMLGDATSGQIGAFLVALRMKGEASEEIAGCADAMRAHAVPVHPRHNELIDTAGTGGDGAATLNISTAAALVAAAGGARVAKHGNRAVSSASGSADVLEALGFNLELHPGAIAESIDRFGFGFLFAPAHHPAMRHAGPVRKELATRTVFNILGPLTNPTGAQGQVIGVYGPHLVGKVAEVLILLGVERALVVHGAGGIDELSPAGPTLVQEVMNAEVVERTVHPEEIGVRRCDPNELSGGSPQENADAIRAIFEGTRGAKRDAVLLNAAAAFYIAGLAATLAEGYERAADAVDSGAAGERLGQLVAYSQEYAGVSQEAYAS